MRFELTDLQSSWKSKGEALGAELPLDASPGDAVMGSARAGLLDPHADLLSIASAVESVAYRSASAGVAIALHSVVASACAGHSQFVDPLFRGELIGALTLSSDLPEAHLQLARALLRIGSRAEARVEAERARAAGLSLSRDVLEALGARNTSP